MKRVICLILCAMMFTCPAYGKTSTEKLDEMYASAELKLFEQDYLNAASEFDVLKTYSDSSLMAMYARALDAAENSGNYADAVDAFSLLGNFRDSFLQAGYYTARSLQAQAEEMSASPSGADIAAVPEMYIAASDAYRKVLFFRDSSDRMYFCAAEAERISAALYDQAYGISDNSAGLSFDLLNATVSSFDLPAGIGDAESHIFCSINDYLAFVTEKYSSSEGPFIYNLTTGEKSFLYSLEEDSESWKSILRMLTAPVITDNSAFEGMYQNRDYMQECFANAAARRFNVYQDGEYLYWTNDIFQAIINMVTGETRPVEFQTIGLGGNGNLMALNSSESCFELRSPDGAIVKSIPFDFGENMVAVAFEYANGCSFGLLRNATLDRKKPMEYYAAKIDADGNVQSTVSLGNFRALQGPARILRGSDNNCAIYVGNSHPALLVRFDTGEVSVLASDGANVYLAAHEDFYDENNMFAYTIPLLYPLGLSEDGRHALFSDLENGGLAALDLTSLESRYIMTAEEMEAASLNPMELSNMQWNGSRYIFRLNANWLKIDSAA